MEFDFNMICEIFNIDRGTVKYLISEDLNSAIVFCDITWADILHYNLSLSQKLALWQAVQWAHKHMKADIYCGNLQVARYGHILRSLELASTQIICFINESLASQSLIKKRDVCQMELNQKLTKIRKTAEEIKSSQEVEVESHTQPGKSYGWGFVKNGDVTTTRVTTRRGLACHKYNQ